MHEIDQELIMNGDMVIDEPNEAPEEPDSLLAVLDSEHNKSLLNKPGPMYLGHEWADVFLPEGDDETHNG
jgi:hypothetical protein